MVTEQRHHKSECFSNTRVGPRGWGGGGAVGGATAQREALLWASECCQTAFLNLGLVEDGVCAFIPEEFPRESKGCQGAHRGGW